MTSKRWLIRITLSTFALAPVSPAAAQHLELSISPAVITFASADPDAVPLLSSAPVTIRYRIRQNNRNPWLITVLAGGDLVSGASTIDVSSVSWVATPSPPFTSGTLSRTVAQTLASGVGNAAPPTFASITFRLANSWTYDAGMYTQVLVFTLSAP
ncbi:MAG TPA: hypothetical protein VLD67_02450 [Vicinamibacterales bacterium]|nr:hypothetical protein [Vicinamibacterales bacterium]